MRIAYISEGSPLDINTWSGTPYHIYRQLSRHHEVEWVGKDVACGALWHYKFEGENRPFSLYNYRKEIGRVITRILREGHYDVAISSAVTYCTDLKTDIPLVYFSDASYKILQGHFIATDKFDEKKVMPIERECLDRADKIIVCSEMLRQTILETHHVEEGKIELLDFGANIPEPDGVVPEDYDDSVCRLVFVGRNWEWKGGQKALDAYRKLKADGFNCQLTIIGSSPLEEVNDPDVRNIVWLDKAKQEDMDLYADILRHAHFMVLPTKFDAYGIVFCEASAYGVPSIAPNVGGVGQPIRDGVNGFLMSPEATADDYAAKIRSTFQDKELYRRLRVSSRREYETRLNWNVWGTRVTDILTDLLAKRQKQDDADDSSGATARGYYLPVYAFNLKERPDRLDNLKRQFADKQEFDVTYMEAVRHERGNVGLWHSIRNAVQLARRRGEDLIALCEDDHVFTDAYRREYLFSNIAGAYKQGAELLNCGVGGFGTAVPVAHHRSWVDWFWSTQFVVVFAPLFDKILSYEFKDTDTADGVLSQIALKSMALYPAISTQMDCGYSDIAQHQNQSAFQNGIYRNANARLKQVHGVYRAFFTPK